MTEEDITPELEAFMVSRIMENKPYFIALENALNELGTHGILEVKLEVRGRKVERMSIIKTQTWIMENIKANLTQT